MSAEGSARAPVTFHDVAVYFSEDEWEFLEEWQKELYKNVMREIHGVLISMGYAIVNPDTLFRVKKEENLFVSNDPACKKRESSQGHASGSSSVLCPDILLRIKQEEEPVLYHPPVFKKRERILNSAPQHPAETSIISVRIKEEEDPYPLDPPHLERTESFNSPTTNVPIVTSVFSLNNKPEDATYSRGHQDLGKGFLDIPPGKRSDYPAIEKKARLRNMKFNLEELEILIDEVVWHHDKLFGTQSTRTPISEKCVIWEAILERINAVGRCSRNTEMLKKRWNDFKRKTKEKLISNRESGGVPSTHQKLSSLEKKVATVLQPEQMEEFVLQPEQVEGLVFLSSPMEELSEGIDTFRIRCGTSTPQKQSDIAKADSTVLHAEQMEDLTGGLTSRGELSKQERQSDLERKVATVLHSEQIEGLSSSKAREGLSTQHRLSDLDKQVAPVLQSEQIDSPEGFDTSRTRAGPSIQHKLSELEKQVATVLHQEQMEGMTEGFATCRTSGGLSMKHNISDVETQVAKVLNQEQEELAVAIRTSSTGRGPSTHQKCIEIEKKVTAVLHLEQVEELAGNLNTFQTGRVSSTKQKCSIQDKKVAVSLQLGHIEGFNLQPEQIGQGLRPQQLEELDLQPEQIEGLADDFDSSESESAFEEASTFHIEEESETPDQTEVEDVSESPPRESHHHTDKKEKESMDKECLHYAEDKKGKATLAKVAQHHADAKKGKEAEFKEPTFPSLVEAKIQPCQTTTPLKPHENLPRGKSLTNGPHDDGVDSQSLPAVILPLVEKFETFVDLQHKQYGTLKCSVRQMNVHLHNQTRALMKINTSLQKQTSAINRLARAQQASARSIESLAVNMLQTNTRVVEGNAALNKTLQGAMDMLQVVIKAHCQQQSSPIAEDSITASTLVEPTPLDVTSLLRQTTGVRRLRRSLSGELKTEGPSTIKKLKKRMRNTSLEIIPI